MMPSRTWTIIHKISSIYSKTRFVRLATAEQNSTLSVVTHSFINSYRTGGGTQHLRYTCKSQKYIFLKNSAKLTCKHFRGHGIRTSLSFFVSQTIIPILRDSVMATAISCCWVYFMRASSKYTTSKNENEILMNRWRHFYDDVKKKRHFQL